VPGYGADICGEETALLESLEGKKGCRVQRRSRRLRLYISWLNSEPEDVRSE